MKQFLALTCVAAGSLIFLAGPVAADINLAAGASGPTTRIGGNLDSWVALAMLLVALLTAWALNAAAPARRAVGTLLAAAACLALSAWFFFFVLPSGFLEDPKPHQTPLDAAKPAFLWAQALVALAFGGLLPVIGVRQRRGSRQLQLGVGNEEARYGRASRFLHWSTAILFLALIPMGVFASIIPEATPYRNAYYVVHKTLGVVVLLLLVIRLAWNLRSPRPTLDGALTSTERRLAHVVHLCLYGMLFAMPLTGFVMTSFHGYPTFFFAWEFGPFWEHSDQATIIWGTLHKYLLPYLLYLIVGAHILGVLKHHYLDRHETALQRMVG